jgi:hypothetical protein
MLVQVFLSLESSKRWFNKVFWYRHFVIVNSIKVVSGLYKGKKSVFA